MQANHDKPRLIIVAGPNGSGKTTITREGLGHQWFKGCLYLNPDDIAQQEFSGWNDSQSSLKAAKKATKIRYEAIESHRSLALETVFSSPEKLEFIKYAKQQGYFIRLFFICTESPLINASRVAQRVIEGGHEVPISKIISRYYKSLINAYRSLECVDRLYLYDNTQDDTNPKLVSRFSEGELAKSYLGEWPEWARDFHP